MLPRFSLYLLLLLSVQPAWAEWSGYTALEYRHFPNAPLDAQQHEDNASLVLQPEYHYQWDSGRQLFSFIPFIRADENDDERSHADIRELAWLKAGDTWELRLGIRKVFWGVTESQHLVDIINQTDLVENSDGEDKLGQSMLNLALIGDYGTLDLFVLPYFRERTFAGQKGRLRSEPYVDTTQDAIYQSADKEKHIDYAARWTKTIGAWDMGLSQFYGTSRDPRLTSGVNASGDNVLIPNYDLIHQTGVDIQATIDNWLWKLEAIRRSSDSETYNASTAGLEYTFYGIAHSATDLGLVLEYMLDSRAKQQASPFDDDVLLGLRFTLNDAQSTDALLGMIKDRDYDTTLYSIEASRRLGDAWKLSLEARYFESVDERDSSFNAIRNDDFVQMELAYYF